MSRLFLPSYDDLATFGRDRGAGTVLPSTDLRRGDVYGHTTFGLMVYNGAWLPAQPRAVQYRDTHPNATHTAPGGTVLAATRTIDPAALFGPGMRALVLVDARALVDYNAGAGVSWFLNIYRADGATLLAQDFVRTLTATSTRDILKIDHSEIIAAGATATFQTKLNSPGSDPANKIVTYPDNANNRTIYNVLPLHP